MLTKTLQGNPKAVLYFGTRVCLSPFALGLFTGICFVGLASGFGYSTRLFAPLWVSLACVVDFSNASNSHPLISASIHARRSWGCLLLTFLA